MDATAASTLQASRQWPYLAASAVLPAFVPERLHGIGTSASDLNEIFEMLMECGEAVRAGPAKGKWRLREDVRRSVFSALASRERIHQALDANATDAHADSVGGRSVTRTSASATTIRCKSLTSSVVFEHWSMTGLAAWTRMQRLRHRLGTTLQAETSPADALQRVVQGKPAAEALPCCRDSDVRRYA